MEAGARVQGKRKEEKTLLGIRGSFHVPVWSVVQQIIVGTSLVVQSLKIYLPMQGTQVLSLVGELRFCMPRSN